MRKSRHSTTKIDRRTVLKAGAASAGVLCLQAGRAHAQSRRVLGKVTLQPGSAVRTGYGATFGIAAPAGLLTAGMSLDLQIGSSTLPLQLDRFNHWSDGSLRFGVASVVLPAFTGAAVQTGTIVVSGRPDRGAKGLGPDAVAGYIRGQGGDVEVTWIDRDLGVHTASLMTAFGGSREWRPTEPCLHGRWLAGEHCTEWIASMPLRRDGRPHPALRVWFHARAYHAAGNVVGCRLQVVFDNSLGPQRVEVRDAIGDATIRHGARILWQRAGRDSPPLSWDSSEGRPFRGATQCATLASGADFFQSEDKFKYVEIDGRIAHILHVESPRSAVARIFWAPDLVVRAGGTTADGRIALNGPTQYRGAGYLNVTRRIALQAIPPEQGVGRSFQIEGTDAQERAVRETLVTGSDGKAVSKQTFAKITSVRADSGFAGKLNAGPAALPVEGRSSEARLWGTAIAGNTRWVTSHGIGAVAEVAMTEPKVFVEAGLLPNYDVALRSRSHAGFEKQLVDSLAAQSDTAGQLLPNSRNPVAPAYSCANIVMGGAQPGGRPDLAPVPGQQVAWVLSPDSIPAFRSMLAMGQAFHQWPWHHRNIATGMCVAPDEFPRFTTHYNADHQDKPPHVQRANNSVCQMTTDPEHWMEFNYLPFLATGDLAHYETLYQSAFCAWAWQPAFWPYGTRNAGYERAAVTTNARAMAWVTRNLGHVRACGPDRLLDTQVTADRGMIDRIYARQLRYLAEWHVKGPDLNGLRPEQKGDHKVLQHGGPPTFAYAQWMQSYASAVFAHLRECDVLDENGRAFFDWYQSYTVDQVDPAKTHPAAAMRAYYWRARKADATPIGSFAELYRTMAEDEWPEPTTPLFQFVQPNAVLTTGPQAAGVGTVTTFEVTGGGRAAAEGQVPIAFGGRQIYSVQDKGLGRIERVIPKSKWRGERLEVRILRPFQASQYAPGSWRLQLPSAGESALLTLDPTRDVGDYPYYLMGALALLAGAGVPGANHAWQRVTVMAANSDAAFASSNPSVCAWAIAPRRP